MRVKEGTSMMQFVAVLVATAVALGFLATVFRLSHRWEH
jgi:hypothetical protein